MKTEKKKRGRPPKHKAMEFEGMTYEMCIRDSSRLFQVTTDCLLNDEYQSDNDLQKVKEVKTDGIHQICLLYTSRCV